MAAPKPNPITTFNLGLNGEQEYVLACRGRPFSLLTTPQLPTPPVNYVDYSLIQDLRLRMDDLQCRKLFFGGEKLRILGRISTSVQCIVDGSSFGNIHFKAYVVEDLKKMFNTHAISSEKLHRKLCPSFFQHSTDHTTTEPIDDDEDACKQGEKSRRKKRKKSKSGEKNSPPKKPALSLPTSTSPPRPICQGNWTKYQSYNGWHPEHGYGGPPGVLRDCYRDRRTGETQGEKPDSWDSEGSVHSLGSAATPLFSGSSDEYDEDIYSNISTVRHNVDNAAPNIAAVTNSAMLAHPPPFFTIAEAREAMTGTAVAAVTNLCPASPNTIVKKMIQNCLRAGMDTANTILSLQCAGIDTTKAETITALQCAGLDTSKMSGTFQKTKDASAKSNDPVEYFTKDGKPYTMKDLKCVWKLRREGRDVPLSLRHVPRRHGPDWCHAGCAERRSIVPNACGYHIGWGSVTACSPDCNGGYCDHYQNAEDDDNDNSGQEYMMN